MSPLDFVIIGLPKAGTSSLYNWLADHPEIQGSTPKETFFFMDKDHPLARPHCNYYFQGLSAYDSFFPEPKQNRLRFEATTHYFYQQTAMDFFCNLNPQPLVIVIIRKPSERIYSSFRFTQENLANIDRSLTFNKYVDNLLNGNVGELKSYFYSESSFYVACKELELSRYVVWLDKWSERLKANRLHLISFGEMKSDPQNTVKQVCNKLGISEDFYDDYDFIAKNKTISIKNQWLHRLARNWGSKLPGGKLKNRVKSLYYQLQQSQSGNEDAWTEGIHQLDKYFVPWDKQLTKKYTINLTP